MTHVDSFKEYVDDLETFVTKEVVPRSRSVKVEGNGHLIYVANSMAGKC
jgi:alpha-beta hydrolase superfamily lysophospholipase